jgi:hypothetical protein
MKQSQHLLVALGLLAVAVVVIVLVNSQYLNCQAERPQVPVYPGSVPLGEYPVVQTNTHEIIQYEYSTSDNTGLLQAFYTRNANCENRSDDFRCTRALDGNSSYTAIIPDTPNNSTSYVLQLNWDRCGIGWEGIE